MAQSERTYELNTYRLGEWLVPVVNRVPKLIVFLKALLSPLISLHDYFWRFRKAKLYQLKITGQVCYLERLLNDKYDFTQRRIKIGDAVWHLPWFIYQEEELKPQFLYQESENKPVWLYTDGEAGEAKDDFVVFVPIAITVNETELRTYLDSYRLFGTKYKIERV